MTHYTWTLFAALVACSGQSTNLDANSAGLCDYTTTPVGVDEVSAAGATPADLPFELPEGTLNWSEADFEAQGSWTAVADLDEAHEVLPTNGNPECDPASLRVPAELTLAIDGFEPWSDLGVYFQSLDAPAPGFFAHGDLVVDGGGSLPSDESWSFSLEATDRTLEVVLTAARIEENGTQTVYTFATGQLE